MKKYLAPSILAADFANLGEQLQIIENEQIKYLHLDVMDGMFVPSISFGMPLIKSIRRVTDMKFDVHMMVVEPERYFDVLKDAGADIIAIHAEACKNPTEALKKLKDMGITPAIAFNPETAVDAVRPYLPYAEQVLLMSVNPGFGGQKFIEASYERIKQLAAVRQEMNLDFLIEVDGGANFENAGKIADCNADIIVAGSAVFNGNIKENIEKFKEILK